MFALQPTQPIMVRVAEQPVETTSVGDILVGALGLTGVLLIAALLLGLALGGALIGIKLLRARWNMDRPSDPNELRVTPGGAS